MTGPRMTPTTNGRRWHVQCAEHKLDRLVDTESHATNLLALHLRKDHAGDATPGEPQTLDLSKAADYVLVCHADGTDPDATRSAESARYASLDLWEALTGLVGDAALDYARAIRETGVKAAPIPF